MRNRKPWALLSLLALVAAGCGATQAASDSRPAHRVSTAPALATTTFANWPTYHQVNARTGFDSTMPTASTTKHTLVWNVTLDGAAYGEPLVIGSTAIVATENNTVYAITNNAVVWKRHLATPVPLNTLPCGNIDPLGITGTPVFANNLVYVVTERRASTGHVEHRLWALTTGGSIKWSRSIDPPNSASDYQQQRAALLSAQGYIWVALGGLAGDCGPYHGWIVGVKGDNTGYLYRRVGSSEAGIWAASGPAADSSGYAYFAVGNGTTSSTYDYSDSVLKMNLTSISSYFAPSSWQQDNINDADLGSQGPALIPGGYVFADGKNNHGYLLRQSNLGGIGHQLATVSGCSSFGGTAYFSGAVFVPCDDGLRAIQITSGPGLHVLWHISPTGSPVIGGGYLWLAASDGNMYQIRTSSGAIVASWSIGSVTRFTTPTLHGHLVIVATKTSLRAYQVS